MSRKSRDLFCIFAMTRQIQKISLVYFKLHKPAITTWTKIRIIFQNEDSVKMCAAASLSSHHSALCSYFVNSPAQIIYFETFSGNINASNWWGDKIVKIQDWFLSVGLSLSCKQKHTIEHYVIMFWKIRRSRKH